ncbi:hypothetical protein CO615_07845 [Lysobacteraceae bacterium NML75-0749]|nr:hypothetical protein CO615_07845 [Xanthomonadaceae bacterium NML75-0749]PJK05779.1 hypothetical protein CO609_02185 [Xanthomonadaceae bacterium NML91-0268]PJK06578.1 hypothetical protein CO612_03155 [Xanthomonadaceae bacterium NML71-0210]PJK10423.1 hypothetical protein CO610_02815 [Xanthomonadaceae bacterium NML95-0200]
MDSSMIFHVIAAVLILIGIFGIFLPALPGLPLVFAGLLLSAWVDGFHHVHWGWMIFFGLVTAFSLLLDFWATAAGAKKLGASRLATWCALLGTVIGLFFGLPGVLVGPFIGAMTGELISRRSVRKPDIDAATKIGIGTWLGIVVGTAMKLALAFAMVGMFVLVWWL